MSITIVQGHCVTVMSEMASKSVQAIITSPPYWGLRNYGTPPVDWGDWSGELGREPTPQAYIAHLVEVFRAARDVLADDGTLWVNLGDTYGGGHYGNASARSALKGAKDRGAGDSEARLPVPRGLSHKCLVGVPWRFALAMIDDGWILRQDIIWAKPNPMPESVRDRCTKAHEYVFLFVKQERYWWNTDAMQEDAIVRPKINRASTKVAYAFDGTKVIGAHSGLTVDHALSGKRNRRSVWTVPVGQLDDAHFAAWPSALIRPMILASTRAGDVVLDPFSGSGTTATVASSLGRQGLGIELRPEYVEIAERRKSRTNIGLEL